MRTNVLAILGAALLGSSPWGPAAAPTVQRPADAKPGVVFETIPGDANRCREALDTRRADVMKRKGGKLGSHDWWLWGLTAIDHDRDGDPDLVVQLHGSNNGLLLKNLFKETGKLEYADVTRETGTLGKLPNAEGRKTLVWDLDGDGWLDLVGIRSPHLFNRAGKRFEGAGDKGFEGFNPQAIIDLNGDGHPDVSNQLGDNYLYNPSSRRFDRRPFSPPSESAWPEQVKTFLGKARKESKNRFLRLRYFADHDLDGHGNGDIVIQGHAAYGGDAFGLYLLADGKGRLREGGEQLGLPREGAPVLFRDLNGDGAVDVLVAGTRQGGLYLNDGKGRFTVKAGELTEQLRGDDPYLHLAEAVDWDNDSDLDLIVSRRRRGEVVIYENRGGGTFRPLHRLRGWDADPVAVCDLNDDGLPDVAVGGLGDSITLLVNRSPRPGNLCQLYPRMPAPNLNAVGARVEAFRTGTLGKPGARPFLVEDARPDGTAVHVGLGTANSFDLRVRFPGRPSVEHRQVPAGKKWRVGPEGRLAEIR